MTTQIVVQPNELTCLNCGETFPASWSGCPRCSADDTPGQAGRRPGEYMRTPTVPTINYLREGEFVYVSGN